MCSVTAVGAASKKHVLYHSTMCSIIVVCAAPQSFVQCHSSVCSVTVLHAVSEQYVQYRGSLCNVVEIFLLIGGCGVSLLLTPKRTIAFGFVFVSCVRACEAVHGREGRCAAAARVNLRPQDSGTPPRQAVPRTRSPGQPKQIVLWNAFGSSRGRDVVVP